VSTGRSTASSTGSARRRSPDMQRAATPPSGRKVRSPSTWASGQALRGWDRMRTTRPRHRRECDLVRHVLAVTLLQVPSAFGHGVGLRGLRSERDLIIAWSCSSGCLPPSHLQRHDILSHYGDVAACPNTLSNARCRGTRTMTDWNCPWFRHRTRMLLARMPASLHLTTGTMSAAC
jgi:hypothetical protein